MFDAAQDDWPNFCVILLSDRFPDERSCFQVLRRRATTEIESVDIAAAGLDVFSTAAASFSGLLKQVFHALSDTAGNLER